MTVKNNEWKRLFVRHGFYWSDELCNFVNEYSTHTELSFFDNSDQINLLKPAYIKLGVQYGAYDATSKYLQQRVAPVGDYHGMDVELLLTETGRLIGFCDYLLISWGNQHWSTAISMILSGDTGFKLGVIP